MGPKKRPTRTRVQERRSKKRVDYDEALFLSPRAHELYLNLYIDRDIILGRYVDFDFFSGEGFHFQTLIDRMGWLPAFTLKEIIYPNLVKLFYSNLSWDHNRDVLKSYVKGVNIDLDLNTVAQIMRVPNAGDRVYDHGKWPSSDDFTPADGVQLITNNECRHGADGILRPRLTDLTLQYRLLHHMLTYIVVPKGGHRDNVSFMEVFLLWAIGTGTKINLPYIVVQHMLHAQHRSKVKLPYGMLLTKIFRHHNVHLVGESEKVNLKSSDKYNRATLSRMGYIRSQDHGWIPKRGPIDPRVVQEQDGDEDEDEGDEEDEGEEGGEEGGEGAQEEDRGQSSQQHEPSSDYSLSDLYSRVNSLDIKFDTMLSQQQQLMENQQQNTLLLQQLEKFLYQQFPPPS